MKKILITLFIFTFLISIYTFTFAAPLTTITTDVSSKTIKPGENVTVNVNFGQNLGKYTITMFYDNNLFEYISSTGGTTNDKGDRIKTSFYDNTGGSSPSNSMSVTFKAKSNLLNTNPTNFSIVATNLANTDSSIAFDDIKTPIVKDITIKPDYKPYTINLLYTDNILKNEYKDMQLNVNSSLGKSFSNTRIVAELTSPSNESATLLAIDGSNNKINILADGFGSASGDPIGGLNISKQIKMQGMFAESGNYSITFKLIDKKNYDNIISQNTFNLNVGEITPPTIPPTPTTPEITPEQLPQEQTHTTLPKTGSTIYQYLVPLLLILSVFLVLIIKEFKLNNSSKTRNKRYR